MKIQSYTCHTIESQLTLSGQTQCSGTIYVANPHSSQSFHGLREAVNCMIQAVERCPVTRYQKEKLYKLGISPKLNWLLTTHNFD